MASTKQRRAFAWMRVLCCGLALAFGSQGIATAQAAAETSDTTGGKKQALSPEAEHQKKLADDTAMLLVLANELKTELDKSSKDTLSLSVIKKAEEVEKLAHHVREEMKKTLVK